MISHAWARRSGPALHYQLQAKRTIFPVIVAGLGIAGVMTLIKYTARALKRIKEEDEAGVGYDESSSAPFSPEAVARVVGVDLGTSFMKIALQNLEGDESKTVTVCESKDGRRLIPAVFYRHSSSEGSRDLQIGAIARAARFVKPEKTLSGFVSKLNDPKSGVLKLDGEDFSVDELCQLAAENLLSAAKDKLAVAEGKLAVAVISVPNLFSKEASERLLSAVRKAGVEPVGYLPDAVASILGSVKVLGTRSHDISSEAGSPRTVAVVDVGGAITQLCLVTVDGRQHKLVKAVTVEVGGEAFDAAIVGYLAAEFAKGNGGLNLLEDAQAKQRLFDAAEAAKHDLATNKSTSVSVPFISASAKGPLHLNSTISRALVEQLVSKHTAQIKADFKDLLYHGGATAPLKSVLLVGGGARMPVFHAMVREVTGGLDPIVVPAPEEVASIGAAIGLEHLN